MGIQHKVIKFTKCCVAVGGVRADRAWESRG